MFTFLDRTAVRRVRTVLHLLDLTSATVPRTSEVCAGQPTPQARSGLPPKEWTGLVGTAIFDEAESHFGTPAKTAIDFLKCHAPMRSRSFSRCKRAISAAWSAEGSVACVVACRAAAVGSRLDPRCSTQRRNTESRRPSSLATVRSSSHSMLQGQPLAACSRP